MADRDAVDQALAVSNRVELFRSEIEARPAAVAVSDCLDSGVLLSEVASAGDNFGRSSFAGIGFEVTIQVDLRPWRFFGSENVCRQWAVVEAEEILVSSYC